MSEPIENVLILQGGGSLGAFGCGVFKALAKSKGRGSINIAAGTSIGGVNAAIISGSKSDHPEQALEEFWLELAENSGAKPFSAEKLLQTPFFNFSAAAQDFSYDLHTSSLFSFYHSAIYGNPKMFVPRWQLERASKDPSYFTPQKWTYLYDHSPLAKTLDKYVDYSKLTPGGNPNARLIITAVNVMTAEPLTFDSSIQQITSKHLLATSAYPLYYFPWVEVEKGVYCWDGGLLSNTPLREVIEASPVNDKRIFIVENYPKNINSLPQNIPEVLHRARDIMFSDKTLHNVKMSRVITQYLRFIDQLYHLLEEHADLSKMDKETISKIQAKYRKFKMERGTEIRKIHYIRREEEHPHVFENADFSKATIISSIREGEMRTNEILEKAGDA